MSLTKSDLYEQYDDLLKISKIPTINHLPTPIEFLKNYVNKSKPVLIKNGYNLLADQEEVSSEFERKSLKNFSRKSLIKNFKDRKITVSATPNGLADSIYEKDKFTLPEERLITVEELYSHLDRQSLQRGGDILYYQKQNSVVTEELPELVNDSHILNSIKFANACFEKLDATNIWIGNKDSISSMHKDPYENMYAVIEGKKYFEIFSPLLLPFVEYKLCDTYSWSLSNCQWALKNENFQTNWAASIDSDKVKPFKIEICPGDLFYLPAFWFHKVGQDDFTLAVNYWYDVDYLTPNYLLHELCKKL